MRFSTRLFFSFVFVLVLSQTIQAQEKPNIILINLDDADSASLADPSVMLRYPNMASMVADGLHFSNLHVTTPICGPSRACLFRAQYAHRTGILANNPHSITGNGFDGGFRSYMDKGYFSNDLPVWMKNAGYHTMMLGKFLHSDAVNIVPQGWDDFYHSMGAKYYNTHRFTTRNDPNGQVETLKDGEYRTNVERDDMVKLIDDHVTGSSKPFFMYLAPLAPHKQDGREMSMIDNRYANWWQNAQVPRTPDFNELDVSDKLGTFKPLPRLSATTIQFVDNYYANRLRALRSFDDMLGKLFYTLKQQGIDDNTYVFLTSDNGFSLGHNRYFGKLAPTDRVTRVPLYVVGPGVPKGLSADHLLAHIDIGPTLVDIANGQTPSFADGKSFAKLVFAPNSVDERLWREPVLIESYMSNRTAGHSGLLHASYSAVRLYDEIYVEFANGAKEYYDLSGDPFQLNNQSNQLSQADKHFMAYTMRDIKKPFMTPISSFSVPFDEGEVVSRRGFLRGYCSDDWGVNAAKLAIKNNQTNKFWNGYDWQDDFVQLPTRLANRRGQITEWSYRLNMRSSVVPAGSLSMWIWAFDVSGNYDRIPVRTQFTIDTESPELTIDIPNKDHQTFERAVKLEGDVSDNHSISEVQMIVRDRNTNKFWNGFDFQNNWTYVNANVQNNRWGFALFLPPGSYATHVRALDDSRNLSKTIPRRYFEITQ